MFADADAKAREYVRVYGLKAKDVMTRFIVTVPSRASLADVAEIFDTHRIRQVPVMDDGKLVGMISRTDLVRKLAEIKVTGPATRPDNGALQKAIWDQAQGPAVAQGRLREPGREGRRRRAVGCRGLASAAPAR